MWLVGTDTIHGLYVYDSVGGRRYPMKFGDNERAANSTAAVLNLADQMMEQDEHGRQRLDDQRQRRLQEPSD